MATVTGYTLTPATGPYAPGSVVNVKPIISDPSETHTFTGTLDGTPVSAQITVQETVSFGDSGAAPAPGLFVPSVDFGTLVNKGDGSYDWTLPVS